MRNVNVKLQLLVLTLYVQSRRLKALNTAGFNYRGIQNAR